MIGQPNISVGKEFEGQAKLILKGVGLQMLKPKFFQYDLQKASIESETYQQIDLVGYDKKSWLGLPVWDIVSLTSPAYTDSRGDKHPLQTLELDIALIEVSNPRNIVKTKIAGRNGTVKEYMSDGDANVNIKGVLSTQYSNRPPYELVNGFRLVCECPDAISIASNFLTYMEIYTIVIEEWILKQREGTRNVYDFELRCCSDIPFEIESNA